VIFFLTITLSFLNFLTKKTELMRFLFFLSLFVFSFASCRSQTFSSSDIVEKWDVFELELNGPSSGNPYLDVEFKVKFNHQDKSIIIPGFYDGDGVYRVRFSPDLLGVWTFQTVSNVSQLSGMEGDFECIAPKGNNHGPVQTVNTHYLQYADGTPFYAVGTTAYQWTSVKQRIQEKTIKTLANSPFNKIRMCVFPKWYIYGNETQPWVFPFQFTDERNDYTKPNFEFFQNLDKRIKQLLDMGIEADLILFHPYDHWGYSQMGEEFNKKYVRYMIARLSAYRNVWWSLANEWDVPEIKESIDWQGLGELIQKEDPHQRLRGIHNWYDTEDHFYDHTQQWITHASIQSARFFQSIEWRERYGKPLLFDEMRYEGDVPSGWGNLTAEEMTGYFWMAGLSGGYGTHGDTFHNDSDTETEVRWWAKGGTIMGKSLEGIAFFRNLLEEAPVIEMEPTLISPPGDVSTNVKKYIYIFSKPGDYYLAYTYEPGKKINLQLEGEGFYQLEVIDTWNMKVVESNKIKSGPFEFETKIPFTLLRIQRPK
jgi:hypothetical protein